MIIKHIKLKNYRQFSGDVQIDFSISKEKKATLILAPNTTGKTTILDAFHWVFYGTTDLKTIINSDIAKELTADKKSEISGEVLLVHAGTEYQVIRKADVTKAPNASKAKLGQSNLVVKYVDSSGQSRRYLNKEAADFVREIIPEDLFPYFFFNGENIEKIGKEISEGKNTKNSAFVKAIKSMLGFNWLYQEQDDLIKLAKDYSQEILNNSVDEDLKDIQGKITKISEEINQNNEKIIKLEQNLKPLEMRTDALSAEIVQSENIRIAEKQRRYIELDGIIKNADSKTNELRREIFKQFSLNGFKLFSLDLIDDALIFLEDNSKLGEGIPGMDESSIEYFLTNLECVCGQKFKKADDVYKRIESKKAAVRPNSLYGDIQAFKESCRSKKESANDYLNNFNTQRELLSTYEEKLLEYADERTKLGKEISSAPDIGKKKEEELQLRQQIQEINKRIGGLMEIISIDTKKIDELEKQKANYRALDEKTKQLTDYEFQVRWLLQRVTNTLNRMEKTKREEMEAAINDIFVSIFNIDIKVKLDDNYGIQLTSEDDELLEDFEDSTSQDAIMAFAFIGGIIKLARNKTTPSSDSEDMTKIEADDLVVEPYPLVMDAPSSSFDISRIESFCTIMPKIAEQVIFFIKDTDGLYVKKYLKDIIGKEWEFIKETKHSTKLKEIR